jgi:ribosomal protein L14E/L6E/L27E
MKSISEKVAESTGKFTGKVTNAIKAAPKATTSKTKAIKNAFVDGVESTKPAKKTKRSEDIGNIFE